jgi:ribosomal-protein-alanine N-acetyltransferase
MAYLRAHVATILKPGKHMTIRISLAHVDDASVIAEMSRLLIEGGLPWTWTEPRVRHYVRDRESAVIIARDGRRHAGFAIMEFHDAHAHLNLLAVRPGYRSRGIGTALMRWLESSARTAGIFDVHLELRATNDGARRFYEKLGYSAVGSRTRYYAGVEDALRMTRNLSVAMAPPSGQMQ